MAIWKLREVHQELSENRFIEDGLILYLDARNPISAQGFGNSWIDLSGRGLDAKGSSTISGGALKDTQPYTTATTSLLNTDTHSIFFMLQINSTSGSWSKIFGYEPSGTDRSPGIWRRPNERSLHWRYDPGNSGSDFGTGSVGDASAQFVPNTWYYVGVTKNGATATYYRNGNEVGTFSVSNPKTSGNAPVLLYPSYNQGTSLLGAVHVYNRVLSSQEVLHNFSIVKEGYGI